MSYSLAAQGPTKQATIDDALAQFAKVVEQQPAHATDHPVVVAVVRGFVGALPDEFPEGEPPRDYHISFSGGLAQSFAGQVVRVSVMATASLVLRKG